MANEKFKIKFGLQVGDKVGGGVADIDATTGDITTEGDVILSDATAKIDTTNLEVTNIKAKDGTAAASIADSTGVITVSTELNVDNLNLKNNTVSTNGANNLVLNTNGGTNSGSITITQGAAGNINITPNTTGDVYLESDTVYVGDSGAAATITTNGNAALTVSSQGSNNISIVPGSGTTFNNGHMALGQLNSDAILITNGTGDLDIRTGSWPTSANIKLNDGADGNIVVDTDGTGQVVVNAVLDVNDTIYANQLQVDNININGNTISSTDTDGNITIDPNGTGKVIIAGDLQVDGTTTTINSTTLDVDDKNITLAKGAANAAAADGGGITLEGPATPATILYEDTDDSWNFNKKTAAPELQIDNINVNGNTISSTDTNGNVIIQPNGTGDIILSGDTVKVGDSGTPANITTQGQAVLTINSGDAVGTDQVGSNLQIQAGNGTGTGGSGSIVFRTAPADITGSTANTMADVLTLAGGSNGNITLDPNGSGDVVLTLANGGNLTNTRNYVFGAIRNATTESNGDIWVVDADSGGAGTLPVRGVSIDNSADTAKTAATIIRNYSNIAAFAPRVVFERSRGTAASPTTLSSGDILSVIGATGYSSTLGWINDTLPFVPAFTSFSTSEAWVNNTNLGTQFNVVLAPSATTITTAANLITTIAHSPQSATYRADAFTFRQGKTGTTDLLTLGTATAALRSDAITLETSAGTDMLTLSTTASNIYTNSLNIRGSGITAVPYISNITPSTGTDNAQFNLSTATSDGSKKSSFNFNSYRFDGTNLSATQNGDVLGEYKFNGNTATSGSTPTVPGAPGANIVAAATENWTNSANGTKFTFSAIKTGTLTSVSVIDASPSQITLQSDNYEFRDSSGTLVTRDKLDYTRTYGEFCYTNSTITPAAADTIYAFPLDTTNASSGTSISNTSRVNISVAGVYKIIMSLQVKNADNANDHILRFWLRKNGADVANSATLITPLKLQEQVVAMDWLVESDGDDYWEIVYYVNDTDVTFPYYAGGSSPVTYPAAPPIIVNVISVGA